MAKKNKVVLTESAKAEKLQAKKDAFVRVVTPRVNKACKAISLVANCATSNYSYISEQAAAITAALQRAVDGVVTAYAKKADKQEVFSLKQ
jgi:hypothetical protein